MLHKEGGQHSELGRCCFFFERIDVGDVTDPVLIKSISTDMHCCDESGIVRAHRPIACIASEETCVSVSSE